MSSGSIRPTIAASLAGQTGVAAKRESVSGERNEYDETRPRYHPTMDCRVHTAGRLAV
ncbi:hypothetical protein OAS86_00220 [Gammaproteobacteria bacterium]|nr:hypothetical protein [Gammaproteobacteria bacterium]